MVTTIISDPFEDLRKKEEETVSIDQGVADPFADLNLPKPEPTPQVQTPAKVDDPFQDFGPKLEPVKGLTKEDVINDQERMDKIRKMMSTTKDVYYETAPAEEVMEDFMTHMRWMNTNELSTAKEAINISAADDNTKAIYGDAFRVYDEMGSIFSNGDGWNGVIDYGTAFVASPSLWLGLGIGKIAGAAGSKAASKAATTAAINAATQQVVKKSGGKVVAESIKTELKNTAAKAAARYHIAGALAVEAPVSILQDYLLQDIRMDTGVQDEFDFVSSAISAVAGSLGAAPSIYTLRRSAGSSFSETGELLDKSYALRAKNSAKRAAPKVKASLDKAQTDWLKLAEAGIPFESNVRLQNSVLDWFFDVNREDSLVRILQAEGADFSFEEGAFTRDLLGYALNMGDESLEDFNKVFEPLGVTFGEATEILANTVRRGGQTLSKPSIAARFFKDMRNVSVAKKNAADAITKGLDEAPDAEVTSKDLLGYTQSLWKKMLVSTFPTTAVNVKGWAIARSSTAMSDLMLAGGYLGRAGMRAVIDPAGAIRDLKKIRALAQNQTFALQTLVDPFLSAEAFNALLERAPTKIRKSVTGQIYGGVEDFSPERFGLSPTSRGVKTAEGVSDFAQKISLVHLQDTLTKGVSGLTALDKQSRLNFGKGIQQLVEDGEAWKLTDEMWEKSMQAVLRETFSEDLSKGNHYLRGVARFIQDLSVQPGVGFILPFGKFLNNTVAFTYRHSPLAYFGVMGRIFRGQRDEAVAEMAARATVGTMALGYLSYEEGQKQAEGLQWFERRNDDGSIEDITNLFPYSVYALTGRILSNWHRGEGMDQSLVDSLLQQLGPLDALESVAAPSFIKDFARYLTDTSVAPEEKQNAFETVGDVAIYLGANVAEIAAGFTRPLDLPVRVLSYGTPEMGGGYTLDRKQAEGMDKVVLGLTRYVSGVFNFLAGEENEYGVRMYGEPKESAMSAGPVMVPNPAGSLVGTTLQPPASKINKVMGMVDKPPFRVDSFTSGVPEYDAFMNKEITPLLEQRAAELLKNPTFINGEQSVKIKMVDNLIQQTRQDVLSLLEGMRIGDPEERLLNERRKLLVLDRSARRRAMKALGITTDENKLSLYEIEAIRRRMDLEEDSLK